MRQAAEKTLAHNPRIVACASTTQQNCACFAFFRVLKKMRPDIITVLGGPNCERVMGKVIAEKGPMGRLCLSAERLTASGEIFAASFLKVSENFQNIPAFFRLKAIIIRWQEALQRNLTLYPILILQIILMLWKICI